MRVSCGYISCVNNSEFLEDAFSFIATAFEVIGTVAMVAGFVVAASLGIRALARHEGGGVAFKTLRVTLGGAILLGLEVLVAADLVRTITSNPSVEDAAILGLIVLIRTVLSISIQIEIDGCLPWRRAALTSGASIIAQQVKNDKSKSDAAKAATATVES